MDQLHAKIILIQNESLMQEVSMRNFIYHVWKIIIYDGVNMIFLSWTGN
jgi:hypothetical protein